MSDVLRSASRSELIEALKFALEHGVTAGRHYLDNDPGPGAPTGARYWRDRGCGCCSGEIEVPKHIEALLEEALK